MTHTRLQRQAVGNATRDRIAIALVGLLAILMRFPGLTSKPGYDWDEPVYTNIASSLASGDGLHLKTDVGAQAAPYLYHPPFYFWLLSGWFKVFGEGIGPARWMAAVMSLFVLGLLFTLMRRRWGVVALVPIAILATDGWLVFSNRVSWIENTMLVIAAAAILAYDRALRSGRTSHFALAGALVGATVIFKHVGVYVLLAVLCTWVVVRRDRRGHLTLIGVALGVIAAYVLGMIAVYGHWYLDASQVQIERLTGHKQSRGSIHSSGQVISAVLGPYAIFAVTLILSGVSLLLVAWRSIGVLRRRPVDDPVLFGWALAAALTFAASGLKMAHYFMMIEIPLLLFLFSEAAHAIQRASDPRRFGRYGVIGLVVILAANFATYDFRLASRSDNALKQVQQYAATNMPADSLVLTEETVGAIVRQPYCKFYKVGLCETKADYVITYTSRTQAPPNDPRLQQLIAASKPVKVFKGFKETITVYATPRRSS